MDKEEQLKELEFIQNCISRMAKNSFSLKSWFLTLISAVLAFVYKEANGCVVLFCFIIPICIFWGLDAYFLRLERMYRKLYEWAISERPKGNEEHYFDLSPNRFKSEVESLVETMFSNTLFPIYGIPFLIALFAECYLMISHYCSCC